MFSLVKRHVDNTDTSDSMYTIHHHVDILVLEVHAHTHTQTTTCNIELRVAFCARETENQFHVHIYLYTHQRDPLSSAQNSLALGRDNFFFSFLAKNDFKADASLYRVRLLDTVTIWCLLNEINNCSHQLIIIISIFFCYFYIKKKTIITIVDNERVIIAANATAVVVITPKFSFFFSYKL